MAATSTRVSLKHAPGKGQHSARGPAPRRSDHCHWCAARLLWGSTLRQGARLLSDAAASGLPKIIPDPYERPLTQVTGLGVLWMHLEPDLVTVGQVTKGGGDPSI